MPLADERIIISSPWGGIGQQGPQRVHMPTVILDRPEQPDLDRSIEFLRAGAEKMLVLQIVFDELSVEARPRHSSRTMVVSFAARCEVKTAPNDPTLRGAFC